MQEGIIDAKTILNKINQLDTPEGISESCSALE